MIKENIEPFKMRPNRVWRTYKGGRMLSEWLGEGELIDSCYPEEWIASSITARNCNAETEGMTIIQGGRNDGKTLLEFINENVEEILGKEHKDVYGTETGVLTKILDAAERLSIQVHPTAEKAKALFDSKYGKTEAWYILGGRDSYDDKPHIYAGLKPETTAEKLRDAFYSQNIGSMLKMMHKIYVKPGQLYLIPGGVIHAIGEGCLILEIQEATDYTIRLEKTSISGTPIEDYLIHQGLGFEKMFECFDFTTYTEEEILKLICIVEDDIINTGYHNLIKHKDTNCFTVDKLNIEKGAQCSVKSFSFQVLVVIDGAGLVSWNHNVLELKKGSRVFVPHACQELKFEAGETGLSIILCGPPKS